MAIEISGITSSVIGEIPQNNNGRKKEVNGLESGQAAGSDKVSISEGASFIGSLKSAIDNAQSAPLLFPLFLLKLFFYYRIRLYFLKD